MKLRHCVITDTVRVHFKNATVKEIEAPTKKWVSKAKEKLEREMR